MAGEHNLWDQLTSEHTGYPVPGKLNHACNTADIPSAVSGYAIGCILRDIQTGKIYSNQGTLASCTFTELT